MRYQFLNSLRCFFAENHLYLMTLSGTSFTHSLLCEEDCPKSISLQGCQLFQDSRDELPMYIWRSSCEYNFEFKVHYVHCMIVDDGQCTTMSKSEKWATWSVRGCTTSRRFLLVFARNNPTRGAHGCQYDPQVRFSNRKGSKSLGSSEFPPSTESERWEAAETTLPISLWHFCAEKPHHSKAIPPSKTSCHRRITRQDWA